jgi:hypothetical protein
MCKTISGWDKPCVSQHWLAKGLDLGRASERMLPQDERVGWSATERIRARRSSVQLLQPTDHSWFPSTSLILEASPRGGIRYHPP